MGLDCFILVAFIVLRKPVVFHKKERKKTEKQASVSVAEIHFSAIRAC